MIMENRSAFKLVNEKKKTFIKKRWSEHVHVSLSQSQY